MWGAALNAGLARFIIEPATPPAPSSARAPSAALSAGRADLGDVIVDADTDLDSEGSELPESCVAPAAVVGAGVERGAPPRPEKPPPATRPAVADAAGFASCSGGGCGAGGEGERDLSLCAAPTPLRPSSPRAQPPRLGRPPSSAGAGAPLAEAAWARWVYDDPRGVGFPLRLRSGPSLEAAATEARLLPGQPFEVCEELRGADGVAFLRLADGRGWAFDRCFMLGLMCRPARDAAPAAPSAEARVSAEPGALPLPDGPRRAPAGAAEAEAPFEDEEGPDTVTLHFRLGLVMVKEEPVEEPEEPRAEEEQGPEGEGLAGGAASGSGALPAGDLRRFFQKPADAEAEAGAAEAAAEAQGGDGGGEGDGLTSSQMEQLEANVYVYTCM